MEQLERRIQLDIRNPSGNKRSVDHNRDLYNRYKQMVSLTKPLFHSLVHNEFGIRWTAEEIDELFLRFGRDTPEGRQLNLEHHIARIIRNEASVGSWSGAEMQPMGLHMGLSVDLRQDDMLTRSSFKKRAGAVPLCDNMVWEDSMKLLSYNKEMLNYDGTVSNLNPNRLGDADNHLGVAMSPAFKPRNPMQRVSRQIQKGIMGAQDQWNDSTLVRGYADTWVPPCGRGSWSVEPTQGGDVLKIGEGESGPALVGGAGLEGVLLNQPQVSAKSPMPSGLMLTAQAASSPGLLQRSAESRGSTAASWLRPGNRGGSMSRGSQRGMGYLSPKKKGKVPCLYDRKSVTRSNSRREFDLRQELFAERSGA